MKDRYQQGYEDGYRAGQRDVMRFVRGIMIAGLLLYLVVEWFSS